MFSFSHYQKFLNMTLKNLTFLCKSMIWVYNFPKLILHREKTKPDTRLKWKRKKDFFIFFSKELSKRLLETNGNAFSEGYRLKDTDWWKNANASVWIWLATLGHISRILTTAYNPCQRPENLTGENEVSSPVHSHTSAHSDQLRAFVQIKRGEFECLASWEIKGQRVY